MNTSNSAMRTERHPTCTRSSCEKYRRWARVTKATMCIQHKPGEAMQVDWAGNTIPIFDPVTGEESVAYLFIAVLPCSCYAYVEACPDMKTEMLGAVPCSRLQLFWRRYKAPDSRQPGKPASRPTLVTRRC